VLWTCTFTNIVVQLIRQRLSIYEALEDVSLSGGIHSITLEVMYRIYLVYRNREISKLSQDLKEGNITSSVYIAKVRILLASSLDAKSKNGNKLDVMYYIKSLDRSKENNLGLGLDTMFSPVCIYRMIELLERSLEANSKNYKNPSLGYVFIMNNRRFIEVETKLNGQRLSFGDDWLHKNMFYLENGQPSNVLWIGYPPVVQIDEQKVELLFVGLDVYQLGKGLGLSCEYSLIRL